MPVRTGTSVCEWTELGIELSGIEPRASLRPAGGSVPRNHHFRDRDPRPRTNFQPIHHVHPRGGLNQANQRPEAEAPLQMNGLSVNRGLTASCAAAIVAVHVRATQGAASENKRCTSFGEIGIRVALEARTKPRLLP